jgi:hypothetical protein
MVSIMQAAVHLYTKTLVNFISYYK